MAVLLVVAYSTSARATLRNVCSSHEETIVRRFGRAATFEATELGAFLALRLREKHPADVQIERIRPFNEFEAVPDEVREAAVAYENRETESTPYAKFAAGDEWPDPGRMRRQPLEEE